MPELPEVETVVNQLEPLLKGQEIVSVAVHDKARIKLPRGSIPGQKIKQVIRVGKEIVLPLSGGKFLSFHLRMTGRLLWNSSLKTPSGLLHQESSALEQKHLRLEMKLKKNGKISDLKFFDVRKFGTVKLVSDISQLGTGGVEPLGEDFTLSTLQSLIGKSSQSLRNFLMRQDKIVGLGNIYVCEILFSSGLHPERTVDSLTTDELSAIKKDTQRILKRAIKNCGTTFSDFQQTTGETGSYQKYLKVYGREGEPCSRCETEIVREKTGGRSSFYCPGCQE